MSRKKSVETEQIELYTPDISTLIVDIVGDTPLHIHRLGKKMRAEFEARDANKPIKKKQARNYEAEFMDSLYFIDKDGFETTAPKKLTGTYAIGFPSSAFKKAMVSAARQYKNITMTELRGRFFVNQYRPFVYIRGKPKLEKFWRRIGGKGPGTGTPDIGIRAVVFPWSATLEIRFLKSNLSTESILNLCATAGFCVGIGGDRPEKTGNTGGLWHLANGSIK